MGRTPLEKRNGTDPLLYFCHDSKGWYVAYRAFGSGTELHFEMDFLVAALPHFAGIQGRVRPALRGKRLKIDLKGFRIIQEA
jgi:hypothetical protein